MGIAPVLNTRLIARKVRGLGKESRVSTAMPRVEGGGGGGEGGGEREDKQCGNHGRRT